MKGIMEKNVFYVAPSVEIYPMEEMPQILANTKVSGSAGNSGSGGGWEDAKWTEFDEDENNIDPFQSPDTW